MGAEYDRLLFLLKRPDSAVRFACRVGSRVYGTAGPNSDHDYLVVLADPGQKQDLLFAEQINVVVHGVKTFEAALADGGVFAYEAVFAPAEHVIKPSRPPFPVKVDKKKLAESACARSKSDFEKAKKTFEDEPEAAKKKLFHSLRVPMFALQLARSGKITDFAAANARWAEIRDDESLDIDHYASKYAPVRATLCDELTKLAPRK